MKYSKLELINKSKSFIKKNDYFITFLIFNYEYIDFKNYINNFYSKIKNFSLDFFQIIFFDFNTKSDFTFLFECNFDNIKIIIFDKKYNNNIFFIYSYFINEIKSEYLFFVDSKIEIIEIDYNNVLKIFKNNEIQKINLNVINRITHAHIINYKPVYNLKKNFIYFEINFEENDFSIYPYNFFVIRKSILDKWLKEKIDFFLIVENKEKSDYKKDTNFFNNNLSSTVNIEEFFKKFFYDKKYIGEFNRIFNFIFNEKNEILNKLDLLLFIRLLNGRIYFYDNKNLFDNSFPKFRNYIKIKKYQFYYLYIRFYYFEKINRLIDSIFIFFILLNKKISIKKIFWFIKIFNSDYIKFLKEFKKSDCINFIKKE